MNKQKFFLYVATAMIISVNTNAMEKNSDAMVAAPSIRNNVSVGENLHANQIARSSLLARLEASSPLTDQSRYAAPSTKMDIWLMALAGAGLIVLQLRRKQKTLPQRPLIFSDNKLNGGQHAQQHSDVVGELVGQS